MKRDKGKQSEKRWGMAIDLRRCVGCHSCTVACKSENNVPLGLWRAWVKGIQKGKYPYVKDVFLPRLCNHCDKAPCVEVCPVRASVRRPDGVIFIYYGKCIGCKLCIAACPYEARFVNPIRHTADKCSFCAHRLDQGLLPACVTSCIGRARIFGNLNDPESDISRTISTNSAEVLKPFLGTKPKVYYLNADSSLIGRMPVKFSRPPLSLEEYHRMLPSKLASYWEEADRIGLEEET